MQKVYQVNTYLKKKGKPGDSIVVSTNDFDGVMLNINVFEDEKSEIEDYSLISKAKMTFRKQNKGVGTVNLTHTGSGFSCTLPYQAIDVSGKVTCQVMLYIGDNRCLTTFPFDFTVEASVISDTDIQLPEIMEAYLINKLDGVEIGENGFTAKYGANVISFVWETDDEGRMISLTNSDTGKVLPITWPEG